MPKWLRRYLYGHDLKFHFRIALIAAFVSRTLCAFFVYGPQALDDYKHGVWPAYQFFMGEPLSLPDYRSHLLVWLLAMFLKIGSWVGVSSALTQVRTMYSGLGLFSLIGVYGTYLYVRLFRSQIFGALALYLVAIFPLMPFASTRAFGEAVALSLVLAAFGVLETARLRFPERLSYWVAGFAILGAATLFRFHVGLVFLSYGGILLYLHQYKGLMGGALAGILALAAQACIDLLSSKAPLSTLFIYIAENEGGGAKYGVSPWYNPWLFVLLLTLAPFSFALWKSVPSLWHRHWPVLLPALIFIGAHSLVAHKEERFLYPIVGVEMWMLAWLWSSSAWYAPARRLYTPIFFGLGGLLLIAICLVNSQAGEIEPPAYAEQRYGKVSYLDQDSLFGESRFQFYFLRPPSTIKAITVDDFNVSSIDDALEEHPNHSAVVFLTSSFEGQQQLQALEDVDSIGAHCLHMQKASSLIDRVLFSLNPQHNQRRRPTWYLICERGTPS